MSLTLAQLHQKFGKKAVKAVISPIGKDGHPRFYHRHPYSFGLLNDLSKGTFRIRLYAKEEQYLVTFTLKK